jgi:hypothetical protein
MHATKRMEVWTNVTKYEGLWQLALELNVRHSGKKGAGSKRTFKKRAQTRCRWHSRAHCK